MGTRGSSVQCPKETPYSNKVHVRPWGQYCPRVQCPGGGGGGGQL